MTPKKDALNWFEIAVADMPRAKAFYETLLGTTLFEMSMLGSQMAMFPCDMVNGVGGSLTLMEGMSPGVGGTIVYLNVEGELDAVISRIEPAGGKLLRPRFAIGEHGFIAIFMDTEGNVVGLHSLK